MSYSSVMCRRLFQRCWQGLWLGGGTALVWSLLAVAAWAGVDLRVILSRGSQRLTVGSSGAAVVRDRNGQTLGRVPGNQALTAAPQGAQVSLGNWQGTALWLDPGDGDYVFVGHRWYRGRVLVMANGGGLTAINYVDLEHYLYSVLGGEMPSSWPAAALEAQAVAARSYALYHRNRAGQRPYDVASTTASQVYRGLESEARSTRAAVDATQGQVLTYNGQIIEAVFHSSSGGYTENVEDVWQRPVPYLRSVKDYDAGAPVYEWVETLSMAEFERRIPGIGSLVAGSTPAHDSPGAGSSPYGCRAARAHACSVANEVRRP
ncbi:SpoIID-LytB domain protein [Halomicronema hongdechloris C2206]|uniref:SpoIID-LytB domain protein n=1 Tax=Halomicronema hongdechloris C2206 TaxID=1641165 RepID=A0A1Z3HMX5_9CYAN|nr:SpoIID/LytB domain-containing protein [Halomicronema hongdechloris]ASC71625.1 SpoIID-LytB domain protein [Halomicronema hongdechloris C2206]